MPEQGDPEENAASEVTVAAVGGMAGVLAELAIGGGPAGTAVAAVMPPAVLAMQQRVASAALWRRLDRAARVAEIADEILDPGLGILEEPVPSQDHRYELLARVLEAAARTPMKEKIKALGRVLAHGLQDDSNLGDAFVLAAALGDIEAPHVAALQHLEAHPVPPAELHPPDVELPGWEAEALAQARPDLAPILHSLLAVLAGHGLVADLGGVTYPGRVGPALWGVTDLGRRCLFLLGGDEPSSAGDH